MNARTPCLFALAALVLGGCASVEAPAPSAVAQAPEVVSAPAPVASKFANIEVVTSPKGVTAWLVYEPSIPIISMEMAWPIGSATDPDGLEGQNQLMAAMLDEGAGDLDSQAFATRREELNMGFSCGAGDDWTSCSLTTLSANRDAAFDLVRMALQEPRFDAEPFARIQRQVSVSLRRRTSNPQYLAGRAMAEAFWPDHPYAREITAESLAAVTPDSLHAAHEAFAARGDVLLTVVGDITAEALAPLLDTLFTAPEAGAGSASGVSLSAIPDVPAFTPSPVPLVRELPQPQTYVVFFAPGPARDSEDFFPAYVLNYILGGGGFSSRLMDEIREKRGLTYGIGTGLSTGPHLNLWRGASSTKNESAGELMALTLAEIDRLAAEGPTEAELADAKSYLTGAYPLAFDSNSKIAGQMMGVRQDELGLDYFDRRNDLVDAVTMDDIRRVAQIYLRPEAFTFVLVGQPMGLGMDQPANPEEPASAPAAP